MISAAIERFLTTVMNVVVGVPGRMRIGRKVSRFATLVIVMAVLMLLPFTLTPHTAELIAVVALALLALLAIAAATTLRSLFGQLIAIEGGKVSLFGGRFEAQVPLLEHQVRAFEVSMRLVRRAGIALPALIFFIVWALVYMLIWSLDPAACAADPAVPCHGAYWGASAQPTFGDFLYLSVNMAFANPVPDLIARSQLAKTAATIEVLTGIGLATLYASSFFGLRGEAQPSALTESERAT